MKRCLILRAWAVIACLLVTQVKAQNPGSALVTFVPNTIYNYLVEFTTSLTSGTTSTLSPPLKILFQLSTDALNQITLQFVEMLSGSLGRTFNQNSTSDSNGTQARALEGLIMQFSYINGVIQNVLLDPSVPFELANILRAAASMLINGGLDGAPEAVESDINGDCPTTYKGCSSSITKFKNLSTCTARDNGNTRALSQVQEALLSCTQRLTQGVVSSVACIEQQIIELSQTTNVVAEIKSRLKLLSTEPGTLKTSNTLRLESRLSFDFGPPLPNAEASLAKEHLSEVLAQITSPDQTIGSEQFLLLTSAIYEFCGAVTLCAESSLFKAALAEIVSILELGGILNNADSKTSVYDIAISENISTFDAMFSMSNIGGDYTDNFMDGIFNSFEPVLGGGLRTSSRLRSGNQNDRLAAFEAYRLNPCVELLQSTAAKIFSDILEPSSVRIQSYLALLRCLPSEGVNLIQSVLNTEPPLSQVSSFITSSVQNILQSENPLTAPLREAFLTLNLGRAGIIPGGSSVFESLATAPSLLISGVSQATRLIASAVPTDAECITTIYSVLPNGPAPMDVFELGLCVENVIDDKPESSKNKKERSEDFGDAGHMWYRQLGNTLSVENLQSDTFSPESILGRLEEAIASLAGQKAEASAQIDLSEPVKILSGLVISPTSAGMALTSSMDTTSTLSLQFMPVPNNGRNSRQAGGEEDTGDEIQAFLSPVTINSIVETIGLGNQQQLQIEQSFTTSGGPTLRLTRSNGQQQLSVEGDIGETSIQDLHLNIYRP